MGPRDLNEETLNERVAFEARWPTPRNCVWIGSGYAATGYGAWDAHTHAERWEGWQARAAFARARDRQAEGLRPQGATPEGQEPGREAARPTNGVGEVPPLPRPFKPSGGCTCAGPFGPCEACEGNKAAYEEWYDEPNLSPREVAARDAMWSEKLAAARSSVVMLNGLTEAETAATASCAGLTPAAPQALTFEEKCARNKRVQARYDELMAEGKHGHYETLFRVVREEVERAALAIKE